MPRNETAPRRSWHLERGEGECRDNTVRVVTLKGFPRSLTDGSAKHSGGAVVDTAAGGTDWLTITDGEDA